MNYNNPNDVELQDAYRNLENFKSLEFSCDQENLISILNFLEKIGFVALSIVEDTMRKSVYHIKGWKGKHGPCYDTKKTIEYKGKALAAVDDDFHVFIRGVQHPVCEKTANVHSLAPYTDSEIQGGIDDETGRLPTPFDCDDLDQNCSALIEKFKTEDENEVVEVFYPGPYKMLILEDGSVLRRGVASSISIRWNKTDVLSGCLSSLNHSSGKIKLFDIHTLNQDLSDMQELDSRQIEVMTSAKINIEACVSIEKSFQKKLLNVIENKRNYFLLTGSDPVDELGCCPSEDVGIANTLVSEGILTRVKSVNNAENCLVNTYAFRDEIKSDGEFVLNEDMRSLVREYLYNKDSSSTKIFRSILLLVVLLSIMLGVIKELGDDQPQIKQLAELTQDYKGKSYHFILMHASKRCEMCLNMESFTRNFQTKTSNKKIDLITLNMDKKEIQSFIDENNVFTSSMYLIVKDDGKVVHKKLLKDLWEVFKDSNKFEAILMKELQISEKSK